MKVTEGEQILCLHCLADISVYNYMHPRRMIIPGLGPVHNKNDNYLITILASSPSDDNAVYCKCALHLCLSSLGVDSDWQ